MKTRTRSSPCWQRPPWWPRAAAVHPTSRGGGGPAPPRRRARGGGPPRRLLDAAGRLRRDHPRVRQDPGGRGRRFKTSFGASGEQSRAVEAGQEADVVTFSIEPDMTRLVDAGLVDADWNDTPNEGLVTTSVVSFIVRKGNPKNIKTWDDLLKPGVEVLTPNPFTSGAAKWNLLAAYGAADGGKDPEAGLDYVRELITEHVKVQDKSGREALQNFIGGNGDVLLSYEYEAITANKKGEEARLRHPRRHDQDRHRHRDDEGRAAGRRSVRRLRALRAGPGEVRRLGLPARSTRRSSRPTRTKFPDPPACSRSRTSAAGRRSTTSCSTSRAARSPRSRRTRGCRPPSERPLRPAPRGGGRPAGRRSASASRRCG